MHFTRLILQRYYLRLFHDVNGPKSSCQFFRQSDSQIQLKFMGKKINVTEHMTF